MYVLSENVQPLVSDRAWNIVLVAWFAAMIFMIAVVALQTVIRRIAGRHGNGYWHEIERNLKTEFVNDRTTK